MKAAYLNDEACSCAACEVCAGVQAIKQQSQLGKQEGLGKLYSNLAACYLQQEPLPGSNRCLSGSAAGPEISSWLSVLMLKCKPVCFCPQWSPQPILVAGEADNLHAVAA